MILSEHCRALYPVLRTSCQDGAYPQYSRYKNQLERPRTKLRGQLINRDDESERQHVLSSHWDRFSVLCSA